MARLLAGAFLWCGLAVVLALSPSVLFVPNAYGETYIGGQFGVTLPQSLAAGQVTTPGLPTQLDVGKQDLHNSLMVGLRVGHYFAQARWFGVEAEMFYTTPNIKQQSVTFTTSLGSTSVPLLGATQQIMGFAPNLVFRYPKTRLQPYVAIGPGIFFARIKDSQSGDSQSSNGRIGLNTQVGARYYITRNWAAFAEWKYNYVKLDYSDETNLFGFKTTYQANMFAFGISYHF